MRKFLIASHGTLASGIKSSLEIIVGNTENLFLIEAYVSENKSIEDEVNAILDKIGDEDELIIFTDLLGGSVNNQMIRCALKDNIHIVSGFNLPLIVEIILSDPEVAAAEVIENAILIAKEQIVYVTQIINTNKGSFSHD
jgi:fructoselysine and glucoselysine-specific PTS system IIA component